MTGEHSEFITTNGTAADTAEAMNVLLSRAMNRLNHEQAKSSVPLFVQSLWIERNENVVTSRMELVTQKPFTLPDHQSPVHIPVQ